MTDFEKARRTMVDGQVRTVDVTDRRILARLMSVPRERFVPARLRQLAYIDDDLVIGEGAEAPRQLMSVGPFARLLQLAEIQATDTVLDVGCGTGYSAAVLSGLAASVVAVESDARLAAQAAETLSGLGLGNVAIVTAPLESGHARDGGYDVILIEGAVETVPDALLAQLKDGGRLVAVEGYGRAAPAVIHTRTGGEVGRRIAFDAHVPALPGFRRAKAFVF